MKKMEFYLDSKLAKEASEILESLGLDLETGIRIFLTKIAHEFEWPYEHKSDSSIVSESTTYLGKPTIVSVDEYTYEESLNFLDSFFEDKNKVVNEYLKKINEYKGIPFTLKKREFSKKLLRALKEADDIASGKIVKKGYTDVKKMFEDILNDKS